ncbi:MAG: hypothetical protein NZ553_00345 [Caldilinea sp.]|nr:hypothetical protein [Caldilinea sp.]MDW8438897.1 hypothetical protein [Caldilineaceae bacterium]
MSFRPNQSVITCTAVNLRAAPGYLGVAAPPVLAVMPKGTTCIVTGAATPADGLTWWPVRVTLSDGRVLQGWAAERVGDMQLLSVVEAAPTEPVAPKPIPPLPSLRPPKRNRLGFYLHSTENRDGLWDAISRVQPPVILIHEDAANDILLREVREWRAPNAFVIGRFYLTNDAQRAMLESGDPEGEGRRFAERILTYDFGKFTRRHPNGRLYIDAWMSLNECLPGPASGSYRENPAYYQRLYDAYDRFQVAFRHRLMQEGIEAVAFNFAAGNFSAASHYLNFFPRTLASYLYLGFHEYGWPSLIPGPGTHTGAGLYRSVLQAARRSDGSRHRIVITEAGLTRAYGHPHNPDEGWLNRQDPLDENRYWESLAWYNALLDQDDVVGACLYQVGHRGDWATFRHLGVDNQGRPLRVIDRIVALREALAQQTVQPASAPAAPTAAQQRATLSGQALFNGKALAGAQVRLLGDLMQLGEVREAVLDAEKSDALPFIWDRTVAGYAGTVRRAWRALVAGKVLGIDYPAFQRQFVAYNPSIAQTRGHLLADQEYLLPRTIGVDRYQVICTTSKRGYFRFRNILPGLYTIEVESPTRMRGSTFITVDRSFHIKLRLDDKELSIQSSS